MMKVSVTQTVLILAVLFLTANAQIRGSTTNVERGEHHRRLMGSMGPPEWAMTGGGEGTGTDDGEGEGAACGQASDETACDAKGSRCGWCDCPGCSSGKPGSQGGLCITLADGETCEGEISSWEE